jgi:hypothetical protein
MRRSTRCALLLLAGALTLGCSNSPSAPAAAQQSVRLAEASSGRVGLGFNGTVSGFPTGEVRLTGGGSYVVATASNTLDAETTVKSGGGFDCVTSIAQGPLTGCAAGEGVRWDTEQLLASTTFKCTGAATEVLKTAVTDDDTAVLLADFYRAGDGTHESFTGRIIISATDIAPDIPGIQTLWVQGVGCGTANVNVSR